jgi:hypothetical protein
MYHIELNIIDPNGQENQRFKITEETRKEIDNITPDDLVLGGTGGFSFGSACRIASKYEFETSTKKREFFLCITKPDFHHSSMTEAKDNLSMKQDCRLHDGYQYIRPDHMIELRIMEGEKQVDRVLLGRADSIATKQMQKTIAIYQDKYETHTDQFDVFVIPQNKYGLVGIGCEKGAKLYSIGAIYFDPSKSNLFRVVEEMPRVY